MGIGKRIKVYIDDRGIKMRSIAEKAGITIQAFSAMVNGKRRIEVSEYVAICDALDVPFNQFIA